MYVLNRRFVATRSGTWEFYALRYGVLLRRSRTGASSARRARRARGLLEAVVTQNIDLLHERAGSRDVVEVHGSIRRAVCPRAARIAARRRRRQLESGNRAALPRVRSVLKPDVVFFGELLPVGAIERASRACRRAGLLLVVGSSLEVQPVAGLPFETLAGGGALAIVNRGPTALDGLAVLRLDEARGSCSRTSSGFFADEVEPALEQTAPVSEHLPRRRSRSLISRRKRPARVRARASPRTPERRPTRGPSRR